MFSGLRNWRVDSDQNHGESVWGRPAGHQSGVQEALRVLAVLRHQGEEAFEKDLQLRAATSLVLTSVCRVDPD